MNVLLSCSAVLLSLLLILPTSHAQTYDVDVLVDAISVKGSQTFVESGGSSLAGRFLSSALFTYSISVPDVLATYNPFGSTKGKCRIENYLSECSNPYNVTHFGSDSERPFVLDWAGSDSLLTEEEYEEFSDL